MNIKIFRPNARKYMWYFISNSGDVFGVLANTEVVARLILEVNGVRDRLKPTTSPINGKPVWGQVIHRF